MIFNRILNLLPMSSLFIDYLMTNYMKSLQRFRQYIHLLIDNWRMTLIVKKCMPVRFTEKVVSFLPAQKKMKEFRLVQV